MNSLHCDGENICITGEFDCENCTNGLKKGNKQPKAPIKKPKLKAAPPKQFKRRKK